MASKHTFENRLRPPYELAVAIAALGFGVITFTKSNVVALNGVTQMIIAVLFLSLGAYRLVQALKVISFHNNLLALRPFSMSTSEVPISKTRLYLGRGFRWMPSHRQRTHLLSLPENEHFLQKSKLYRFVDEKRQAGKAKFWQKLSRYSYFKPMPDVEGKAYIHGVGADSEQATYIKQANRGNHMLVLGTTQVGKSRLASILINQDIRNNEAVIVVDPKGDLGLIQDMYSAARVAGRLNDFIIVHPGFPDISAKYNPLASFSDVGEVAERVTSSIEASGEGKQFKDFAWRFLNITASCLYEMNEPISYKSLSFFITRPRQLFLAYCDAIMPKKGSNYHKGVQDVINKHNGESRGNKQSQPITRADAVVMYMSSYIESIVSKGSHNQLHDNILVDLHYAAHLGSEYYSKITASVGPVFDKINKTMAGDVFSWEDSLGLPVLSLEDVIKRKQIVYIGLDAMSNKEMAAAIGKALISDLVSLCGRLYKESNEEKQRFCLHTDELSEVVQDSYITILNKAGSAGACVTGYGQTINDFAVSLNNSTDKAKQLLGNFGTVGMLRVKNSDTAKVLTEAVEQVKIRSATPSTMSNDKSDGKGELFTTYNTDSIAEERVAILSENDVMSLPRGQAFFLTNGGEIHKVRIPMPKNDGQSPPTVEAIMHEVNLCYV